METPLHRLPENFKTGALIILALTITASIGATTGYYYSQSQQPDKNIIARSAFEAYNDSQQQFYSGNTQASEQLLESANSHTWTLLKSGDKQLRDYYIGITIQCFQQDREHTNCDTTINKTMTQLNQTYNFNLTK